MALDYSSDKVTNKKYYPDAAPHSARETHVVTSKVTLDDSVAADDLIGLAICPAGCLPTDITLISDDLDSDGTPAIVLDVGVLNTDEDDLVASSLLIDGSDVGQAGGVARMDDYECAFESSTWLAETDAPDISAQKTIAAKVMTAAATAAAGDIYCKLEYRAVENSD